MGLVLTDSQNFVDIADAIRTLRGDQLTYKPSEMASAITSVVVKAFIVARCAPGDVVTVTNGTTVLQSDGSPEYVFGLTALGEWTVTSSNTSIERTLTVMHGGSVLANFSFGALRTNYARSKIALSNWNVSYSDDFDLVFRHAQNPAAMGQWPIILSGSEEANSMVVQHNFWSGRTVMNFGWNEKWAGDGNVSYVTPYDYENYYMVRKRGNTFSILKGTTLEDISTQVGSASLSGASVDSSFGNGLKLFSEASAKVMDTCLYAFVAYDKDGNCIHRYLPTTGDSGVELYDSVDGTTLVPSASGMTFVETSNPFA